MTLPFDSDYRAWRHQYDTELFWTRRQMDEALQAALAKRVVNRVICEGKDTNIVMQIVHVMETEEGLTVIVR
jgi:hypothetical protein